MAFVCLWGIIPANIDHPINIHSTSIGFPVDCFVFTSGFYGLKLKRDKLISLLGMLVTYSILIYIVTTLSTGSFDIKAFAFSFFPVSTNYWYFFTLYVLLLIISPMLNVCDNWDKAYFTKILMLTGFFYLGIVSLLLAQNGMYRGFTSFHIHLPHW